MGVQRSGVDATKRRYRACLLLSILSLFLLTVACGEGDESPGGVGGTEEPSGTNTPIGNPATVTAAAAMTETSVGPIPTFAPIPPTVTSGGFPQGEAGVFIEGTMTITGEIAAQRDFQLIEYSMSHATSCNAWVRGVDAEVAQSSTEAIFFEMDAYLPLPNPMFDPSTDLNAPDVVSMVFRIMSYDGPGIYEGAELFQRGNEIAIPPGTPVPAIAYGPLPIVSIGSISMFPSNTSYSGIRDDTVIEATIADDGSGELTFRNLYPDAGLDRVPISGTLTWSCTDNAPEQPPTT